MSAAAVQGTALSGSREALAWLQRTSGSGSSAKRDLRLDSRAVRAGDVFIAVAGETTDGRRYLGDAVARGAAAALVDAEGWSGGDFAVPVVAVRGLRDELGTLAAEYYGAVGVFAATAAVNVIFGLAGQRWNRFLIDALRPEPRPA